MKYVMVVSLVLNAGLLMAVLGVFPFLFYVSLLVICGMIWFIKNTFKMVGEINEDIQHLFDSLFALQEHTQSVYEMEMFYGDETLKHLIIHIMEIGEKLEDYKEKYSLEETWDFEIGEGSIIKGERLGEEDEKEKEE